MKIRTRRLAPIRIVGKIEIAKRTGICTGCGAEALVSSANTNHGYISLCSCCASKAEQTRRSSIRGVVANKKKKQKLRKRVKVFSGGAFGLGKR
jgi:hypothetical protein